MFISVTTVPAAGCAAVAAVLSDWPGFLGALPQLGVNMAGIVVAAWAVLLLRRRAAGGTVPHHAVRSDRVRLSGRVQR